MDELFSQKGATWRLVPTGGQYYNGQAERVIGLMKLCLAQTLEGKQCSLMELATVLAEAAQAINSRPIALSKPSDDPTSGGPITPMHLQLDRASIEIPEVQFDLRPNLTKRLKYLEDIKVEFWKKWMAQVFQGQVLAQKWRKQHQDVQVDDVVLVKNETAAGVEYQRGRVVEAIPGEDGHVRSVQVEYENSGERVLRRTLRLIQNLVVIVPADYRFEDDKTGTPEAGN